MAYRPRTRVWSAAPLTAGAVALGAIKEHLRVTSNDEDATISAYGIAATAAVERWTQRLLIRREAVLRLRDLPSGQCPIELPGGVVGSITSVVADGVTITGAYAVGDSPALMIPDAGWPAVTGNGYPVVITYQVGFVTPPADLINAVKMICADMYETRQSMVEGASSKALVSAEWLMAPHRIWAAA